MQFKNNLNILLMLKQIIKQIASFGDGSCSVQFGKGIMAEE